MSFLFFLRWSLYHPVIISSFLFFQVDALPPCLLQIYIILRQKKLFPSLRSNIFKIVGAPPPPRDSHRNSFSIHDLVVYMLFFFTSFKEFIQYWWKNVCILFILMFQKFIEFRFFFQQIYIQLNDNFCQKKRNSIFLPIWASTCESQ